LGNVLQMRFEQTGSIDDLERAITTREQAIGLTPDGHPDLPTIMNNLGTALHSRYELTGSMEDLERAIVAKEQAVESTPESHPDHAAWLNNLGIALQSRSEQTGSMEDLERAIAMNEHAVELTPDGHPNHATLLNHLGNALKSRFERTGSVEDLERAIITTEQAIKSTPNGHPDRALWLTNLGIALQRRFEWTGSVEDLERAIVIKEQALELTPVSHPNHVEKLNNLGIALQKRFQWTGSIEDLERAIATIERAVKLSTDGPPDRAIWLANLGSALQSRFEWTGAMEDLNRAIATKEQAVELTTDGHPDRARKLNNLGISLQRRFEQTGSMEDLERAISANEKAVELVPDGYADFAMMLNNLGISLYSRFTRTGSMEDLNKAIVTNEQAIKLTPDTHPDRRVWLNNLGSTLQSRFERTGSMEDLKRAIAIIEQAIESTPDGHHDRAVMLTNLGIALQRRFARMGSMEDLNRAITISEQAIESAQNDHPDRAGWLNNLGNALQKRFKRTGSMADLEQAIMRKEQAVESDTAPPSVRLNAASSCSDLLISQKSQESYNRAKAILQAAVKLLPTVSPRQLRRSEQQFNISQFSNITSRAVSLLLEDAEDAYKSLQLLELGRGILANLQLEVRSDISVLAASHPDLAKKFVELRDQIDYSSRTPEVSVIEKCSVTSSLAFILDSSKSIAARHALHRNFNDLLRFIRSLEGFENFLQGPSKSELHSLAKDGPIVVFNLSDIRSDAFLITYHGIDFIHLPLLTPGSVVKMTKCFLKAVNNTTVRFYNDSKCELNTVLEWLWDAAVNPILDQLGFTQSPPDERWPRIWWVGTGLLNLLPIHASGYHDASPPRTALDRVISSYAATVKSLAYSRERLVAPEQATLSQEAYFIAMPTTLEQSDLPNVETEIKHLANLFSRTSINIKQIRNPTRVEALLELPRSGIVHFSCHGLPAEDPSQSSLLLKDWRTSPLTVADLVSLNIKGARFAYLSACHTAAMRDLRLLDESISLSSAVQLSGYPSVVGSLWWVGDTHSAEIAKGVYEWILDDVGLNAEWAAEGLHRAVRELRDRTRCKKMHDPLIWASYIHIGM
jgi:tetratricopeptide (TPR) repeat protein